MAVAFFPLFLCYFIPLLLIYAWAAHSCSLSLHYKVLGMCSRNEWRAEVKKKNWRKENICMNSFKLLSPYLCTWSNFASITQHHHPACFSYPWDRISGYTTRQTDIKAVDYHQYYRCPMIFSCISERFITQFFFFFFSLSFLICCCYCCCCWCCCHHCYFCCHHNFIYVHFNNSCDVLCGCNGPLQCSFCKNR